METSPHYHPFRRRVRLALLTAIACSLGPASAIAKVATISSTFDADAEGWTIAGDGNGPTWVYSGDVGGGYISSRDLGQGVYWYFRAPSRFLGNKSAAYGQTLTFLLKQSATDSQGSSEPDVILTGAGLTLVYDATPNPGTDWTAYTIPLTGAAGWKKTNLSGAVVTESELRDVLASLTDLKIRDEFRSGPDTGSLDNFVMTLSEPPTPMSLPIVSTFDTDADGWTVYGDAQGSSVLPTYQATGGNPGGHISATDDVAGGVWYWKASPKFSGNAVLAYGSALSFDLKQSGLNDQFNATDVVLVGGGFTLVYDTPDNPGLTWTRYLVPLTAGEGWKKDTLTGTVATTEDMQTTLAYLEEIRIRGEFIGGPDTGGLDNVVLGGTLNLYGDADGNGRVDRDDVRAALAAAAGLRADANVTLGDVDPSLPGSTLGNGRLSIEDAIRIARYLSGLESHWP
jgi:hypothetical protein